MPTTQTARAATPAISPERLRHVRWLAGGTVLRDALWDAEVAGQAMHWGCRC